MPDTSWTKDSNPSTTWTSDTHSSTSWQTQQIVGLGFGTSPFGRQPFGDPHPNPHKSATGYDALWTKDTHPQ